ncbi:MAG: 2-oxo acid dehydrogenase subunit E2 [Ignavibacteria bacterium]
MIKEIVLPIVSENVEEGDVVKVLVSVGDEIEIDQSIIELETDKALFEVPSSEKGKVVEVNVKEGDSIKIGQVILKVETDKEQKAESKEQKAEQKAENKEQPPLNLPLTEGDATPDKLETKTEQKFETRDGQVKAAPVSRGEAAPASPSVRRFAREIGLNINEIRGTGPGGRISEDDVKTHAKRLLTERAGIQQTQSIRDLPDFSKWGEIERKAMSKIRQITADSMSYAWNTIPQVTQFDNADITDLEKFRKDYNKKNKDDGVHVTMTSILVKIISLALKQFPQFNASIDINKKEIIYKKYINIGIAVDTDRGLLVPVIQEADKKNLKEISIELGELSEKTRNKKISPDEMEGGNFTISNLGGIGGTNFSPIVYSPQAAILGVSRSSITARFINGKFDPVLMLPLSLSYDHRIIDGADAARFLRWVCEALENPIFLE